MVPFLAGGWSLLGLGCLCPGCGLGIGLVLCPGCGCDFWNFCFRLWLVVSGYGLLPIIVGEVLSGSFFLWAFGSCFGLLPSSYVFRGGAVRFSFPLGLGLVYSLVVGFPFWK